MDRSTSPSEPADDVRSVLEQAPAILWTTDAELRLTWLSRLGATQVAPPTVGQTVFDYFDTDDETHPMVAACESARSGESVRLRLQHHERVFECRVEALRQEGAIVGTIGSAEDVSAQVRAEIEIQRLNVDLEQRVAQRTEELARANGELEAFSFSVSHDLRAPLRAIRGFATALEEDCAPDLDTPCREHLNRIQASAERMQRLIDEMLHLSRVSRSDLHRAPVDLSAMAAAVAAELREAEPLRVVDLRIAGGHWVYGDAVLLRVVLDNLLGNAWKYTSRKSEARIEFGCTGGSGEQVFFVRDDGVGFDPSRADRLFAPFRRLHSAAEFEGTGVGLATVQRVIHRHGGRIWAESRVGEGAAFYFTLGE